MSNVHVKKGDTVRLLVGDPADKYTDIEKKTVKTGKVLEVSPKEGKVIVEGINMITKHVKPTRVGQQGGIVKAESPIYACKVQLICPKCGKPTRVGHTVEADTIVDDIYHFIINVFRQVFIHLLTIEDVFAKVLARSLRWCFYVKRLLLERLADNLKSQIVCHNCVLLMGK
ncbi:MAG: 50S ribosomal protein L24 [Bacteroidaceae bacterium]|nr:50S ribosomal protein L24 [Bacteroidaceae bacterium]